jgi:hypothetical protein
MIATARGYFFALKELGGRGGKTTSEQEDAAVEVLEDEFRKVYAAVTAFGPVDEMRARLLFWNGAVLGSKISTRAYMLRLREVAAARGIKLEGAG